MIITRLSLKNFGVYAGTNTFEFTGTKPVVLIGGMNGHGKTTFLNAVLLALYGSNSYAYAESRYHSYGQYLKSFVNETDQTLESYVELEFKPDRNSEERYLIRREWSGAGRHTKEKISAYKNGEFSEYLTENWPMFMENILPSGLSSFFFFDGEKIAEIAMETTDKHMKQSIRALLGINVLEMLKKDLSRIVSKISKEESNNADLAELRRLQEKKADAEKALNDSDLAIARYEKEIADKNRKLEELKSQYDLKGGNIQEQRQELIEQRENLTTRIEQLQEELLNIVAGPLPLALVKDLLEQIQVQASKEHEAKSFSLAVSKINSIFSSYSETVHGDLSQVNRFIDYINRSAKEEKTSNVYELSDRTLLQLNSLLQNNLETEKNKVESIRKEQEQAENKVKEIDNYLNVDIDEEALKQIYKEIKYLEKEIVDVEASLNAEKNKHTGLNGEVIRATSEYNKYVEAYLLKTEALDDNDRLIKYIHYASKILDEYEVRLQKHKIGNLASTMTECYKELANKKNFIEKIQIDPATLNFTYLNSDGISVPRDSLSAGEKQLMVISLLWALSICSKKNLPVIIDTPLSRLDSEHRTALVTEYFPQASKQTIILSTDSEIDSQYYEMMKENIGDEFTLVYDDISRCSFIEKGYFRQKQ